MTMIDFMLVINDYDLDYEDVDSSNDLTSLNGEWTDTFNRIAGDQYHLPNIFLGEYVYGWWILDIDGDQIADVQTLPIGIQMEIG